MILSRSASMLHLHGLSAPKLLSQQFRRVFPLAYGSSASSSSPFRFRFICLNQSDGRWVRGFATAVSTEAEAEKRVKDTFFVDDAVSWKSLGLSDRVSRALRDSGFERPSLTQAACVPSILSGKDVVIAAETGSGKTHGYLAPIIDNLSNISDDSGYASGDERLIPPNKLSLILCPNVLLCEQVVRMANGLLGEDGNPLLRVEAVCGTRGWPVKQPDIIVSTPAALLNNIEPKRKRRLDFLRGVKYVVFDEADMLLCGSFQNQVIRLMNMLRFDEKQLSRLSELEKPMEVDGGSISQINLENEDNEEIHDESCFGEEEIVDDDGNFEVSTKETETRSSGRKDWRRVRKSYKRSKQYIFVAATLPFNGKKTAGAALKHMFPEASWVSGNFLHRHNPRLKLKWVEVTVDTQVDALIEAINQGLKSEGLDISDNTSRTMVFANTVEAVEAIANVLQRASLQCYCYHKNHSLEERTKILADFREKGGIFVCTDAAARGVDVPNISHVIQADFATSAVDFLHRIGRTARAGQYGLVTSLYTETNKELVEAIHQAAKRSQPLETAFSRKRSFRNKLKKRGYVKGSREAERLESVGV